MNSIEIHKVAENQLLELQRISRQTFYEAFSAVNTEDDMAMYLEHSLSIEKLAAELSNENTEFYFAQLNEQIIGYLKFNVGEAQTDLQDEQALEIERIYLLINYAGMGVGQLLMEKAYQVAQIKKVKYIWLGVWEHNTRAIQFYKRNGFSEFGSHMFKLGNDDQRDILMKRQLI
jgi:ribosomal protein S18 acetylase RimI-like enzyme